ncbi:hypothetical protein CEXT_21201 [Caerostris extrusa]|uniref:Uncharacterized protein n=1 Tax=Caerostris extrusa TaxID=172846 RepID=A0AAV4WW32_CAEEX|nr:hypothetical protein CEXT_21201 [Caerostris extrusa]
MPLLKCRALFFADLCCRRHYFGPAGVVHPSSCVVSPLPPSRYLEGGIKHCKKEDKKKKAISESVEWAHLKPREDKSSVPNTLRHYFSNRGAIQFHIFFHLKKRGGFGREKHTCFGCHLGGQHISCFLREEEASNRLDVRFLSSTGQIMEMRQRSLRCRALLGVFPEIRSKF